MLVAIADLHRAMQGLHAPEQVVKWMTDVSGLPLQLIARLYAMEPVDVSTPKPAALQGSSDHRADEQSPVDRSAKG